MRLTKILQLEDHVELCEEIHKNSGFYMQAGEYHHANCISSTGKNHLHTITSDTDDIRMLMDIQMNYMDNQEEILGQHYVIHFLYDIDNYAYDYHLVDACRRCFIHGIYDTDDGGFVDVKKLRELVRQLGFNVSFPQGGYDAEIKYYLEGKTELMFGPGFDFEALLIPKLHQFNSDGDRLIFKKKAWSTCTPRNKFLDMRYH